MTFGLFSSRHAEFSSASHREPLPVPLRGQILKRVQDDILLGAGFVINRLKTVFSLFVMPTTPYQIQKDKRCLEGVSRQEYVQLSISRVFILQQYS